MNDLTYRRPLLQWLAKVGTFFGLSVVWLLCCLPVLTIATSSIALYDSVVHGVLRDEEHPYKRFFSDFKSELLRGMLITVLWLVLALLFFGGLRFLMDLGKQSSFASIYSMVYAGTLLIPLIALIWLIPIESRFEYGFFGLHKTAFTFSLAYLPTSGLLLLVLIATVVLILLMPVLLVLLPAICATVQAVLIEKVFKQYEPAEEAPKED